MPMQLSAEARVGGPKVPAGQPGQAVNFGSPIPNVFAQLFPFHRG